MTGLQMDLTSTARSSPVLGNHAALDDHLLRSSLDAVVATSAENVRFTADAAIASLTLLKGRMAFVVWPRGRAPVMLVAHVEAAHVGATTWIEDVRSYVDNVDDPMQALGALLRELGLDRARIGVEMETLPASAYLRLSAAMPQLRLESAEAVFAAARMRKTPREKALMVKAFDATRRALEHTLLCAREGDTERMLATRLTGAMLEAGADQVGFIYLTAGPNAGYAHQLPGDYALRRGDFVKADVGLVMDSYRTNFGRSAIVGAPTPAQADDWRRLCEVHAAVGGLCRAGAVGRDVFARAQEMQMAAGFPHAYAHNGHGIGLDLHERPAIKPQEDVPFEPGMLVTIETRHRVAGKLGMHMEDLVEITDGEPVWLTGPCGVHDLVQIGRPL
jgi:Xaa-Pro aminopeptidase